MSINSVYEIEDLDDETTVDGFHLTLVDSEGGGEGEGEYVHRVMAVHKSGKKKPVSYLRVTGYYQSYSGTEYNDDWEFVEPREVKVIQYFPVGQ